MPAVYTQTDRALRVTTPLGKDALLLTELHGREEVSRLFRFELTLAGAADAPVEFGKLLGQGVGVQLRLPNDPAKVRHFHGIVSALSQTDRDADVIRYRATVVPKFWLLTRSVQSRTFQHVSVPDILKKVLAPLDVSYKLEGTFHPRDYCVQYRESDFDFASRLMEEEGIFYYFEHSEGGHKLVLANTPGGHPDLAGGKKIAYDAQRGGNRPEARVTEWSRSQELRATKVTLWDHSFELPGKNLEAVKKVPGTAASGTASHALAPEAVKSAEVYDYPGGFAGRFDGVAPGGGDRASDLEKIFSDNARTAEIRQQELAASGLRARGASNIVRLTAGVAFELENHPDAAGPYVMLAVSHHAVQEANYTSGSGDGYSVEYGNSFDCLPRALPFRPERLTPRPTVKGSQTATVVGPAGEEIFTDKYGRVKVQFHWDRAGKSDGDSSCWVRVGTVWAGKTWGVIHIPRIGQEVIIDFLEGDPDQPIIVGSVYNAEQMPAFDLPAKKNVSGFKSNSTLGGGGFNEFTFDDTKGKELVNTHAQFDMKAVVEHDQTDHVKNNRTTNVDVDDTETVGGKQTITVVKDQATTVKANQTNTIVVNRTESVGGNETIAVTGNRGETVGGAESVAVTGARTHTIMSADTLMVAAARSVTVGGAHALTVIGEQAVTVGDNSATTIAGNQSIGVAGDSTETIKGKLSQSVDKDVSIEVKGKEAIHVVKALTVTADESIVLTSGDASITLKKDGTIILKGKNITLDASGKVAVKASSTVSVKGSKIDLN